LSSFVKLALCTSEVWSAAPRCEEGGSCSGWGRSGCTSRRGLPAT
jgi:hypothetical protein